MAFSLQHVVPWGRSFPEYERMFALTPDDLRRRILGCGDGPASFNAAATRHGANVVSVDPLYAFTSTEIRSRSDATYTEVLEQARQNRSEFVWTEFASVEELGRARMAAMEEFLADYEAGRESGRYLPAELPMLPFADRAFDLALSSHFLFLYSEQFGAQFHIDSVIELCRVADEVRLFPLLQLGGTPSPHVSAVTHELERLGWSVQIETVPYEFQRGGNQMLRILRSSVEF
jgi:hypothetical protein